MPVETGCAYAPGARVVIRNEEWIVRKGLAAKFGGTAVSVIGTSELVRGKEATFLTELDEVRLLRPEDTILVDDPSPMYRRSRLFIESLLRRSPPTDSALHIGHKAAMRPTEYQLQPAAKALAQPRQRILMADSVGLGKTIEVGVLLTELIRRGRGDRILVVALKSILEQFQMELWGRFTIPLVRLDSVGVQRVQSRIPSSMNPFYYFDRVIISIDTLKKDAKYRRYLEESHWDVIVVDECQNVAVRGKGGAASMSQRARLAQLLATTCDSLILTSATPHDGRPESFASLMNLLEPTAVADESNYTSEEVRDLFMRRFKKDVAHEVEGEFLERKLSLLNEQASPEEDRVLEALSEAEFRTIQRTRNNKGILFRTLLTKAFLSSPAACAASIRQRLDKKAVQVPDDPSAFHDRELLERLAKLVAAVRPAQYAKYVRLVALLREFGVGVPDSAERVVIFSERIDTLDFLREQLVKDLRLKVNQVEVFHGSLDDQAQKSLVKSFGTKDSPVRILLASDAASEGINLHFFCHRMVHFDLPWSLITLEQRNGRIDRFGQKFRPELLYLLTIPTSRKLQGDLRVLERLIEKENAAHQNLGDAAWLLNLHDAELEEERIGRGIEDSEAPEAIIPDTPTGGDFMQELFGDGSTAEAAPVRGETLSLYSDDLSYVREAFAEVDGGASERVTWHDHLEGLSVRAPDDLKRRFDFLPDELRKDGWEFKLTQDRARVMRGLDEARESEDRWPEWELLWPLHPIAQWLDDRVLSAFEKHEAPVLCVGRGVDPDEVIVLVQGVISNRRSQPMIVQWFGVGLRPGQPHTIVPLGDLLTGTGLRRAAANRGMTLSEARRAELQRKLAPAVSFARKHLDTLRTERSVSIQQGLRTDLRRVAAWRRKVVEQFDARERALDQAAPGLRSRQATRIQEARDRAERLYEGRKDWIDQGMRTIAEPYVRVAAVLIRGEA